MAFLAALLLAVLPARAGVVVPVARGPVVGAIRAQLAPLLGALPQGPAASLQPLVGAFNATIAPTPSPATPEAFAARSFLAEALSSPKALAARAASLDAAGG